MTFGTTQFACANFAVTASAALVMTLHVPLPVHAPDQPTNLEPSGGVRLQRHRGPET